MPVDEKAAQIGALSEALTKANRVSDEALSRIAELEAAIGESVRRADDATRVTEPSPAHITEPLRPFVKQPSDPLVAAWKDAWPGTPDENAREEADKLRGVLPRHGLTITGAKG